MTHVHLTSEASIELALAPADDPRRRRAEECPLCRAALARSATELAALRTPFADGVHDMGAARVRRLVERTLAATTRPGASTLPADTSVDLSWRGTARLWASFARRRLERSPALRWITLAAGLLLAALPVLVWRALAERASSGAIVVDGDSAPRREEFQPRARSQGGEPTLGERASGTAPRADELAAHRVTDLAVENALARDRVTLDRALRSPQFERTSAVRLPGELLACRVERWRGETCGVRSPGNTVSGIEAVLWADILLDDLVRGAASGGELAHLLRTCRGLAETRRPEAELARLTVARAARYGILADASQASNAAEASPFDAAWFDALSTAVFAASAQDDPTVRAWLAYGGPATRAR